MPTRKQRRREQKSRRHEWEYVYVDDEGHEVDLDPAELKAKKDERVRARSDGKQRTSGAQARGRPTRTVQPPTWGRVGKRALMIGPFVIIAMLLLNRHLPIGQRLIPAIIMLAFFLPFSYFTDSLAYKMYRKRMDRAGGGNAGAGTPRGSKS